MRISTSRGPLLARGRAASLAFLVWAALPGILHAHDHVNAGALGSAAGGALSFINGDRYAAESGYVVPMTPTTTGPRAGRYSGLISFTALAATSDFGGPAFGHAVLGAHLAALVESLEGPATGRFGFWEASDGEEGDALTWERAPGAQDAAVEFILSETAGEAGDDPYGHILGRVFTATAPGMYILSVRVVYRSTSGPGAGPWHSPSEPLRVAFQAGITIADIRHESGQISIRYAALEGITYQLERAVALSETTAWEPVGDVVPGSNRMRDERVPLAGASAFFRLRRVGS